MGIYHNIHRAHCSHNIYHTFPVFLGAHKKTSKQEKRLFHLLGSVSPTRLDRYLLDAYAETEKKACTQESDSDDSENILEAFEALGCHSEVSFSQQRV